MEQIDLPRSGLLAWQWEGYPRYHRSRANLLLHIVLVPVFLVGNILLIVGAIRLSWSAALAGLLSMAVSMMFQGRGHRGESEPAVPFSSPANALARIFLEQWITFPRFVLSGGWRRALRNARA
jgi:hypothetical protein